MIQEAVDAAGEGDVIRVASGVYTHVNNYGGLSQILYLTKSVTIQGGYALTNWDVPYPISYPTTLHAQGQGRVLYITGDVNPTVEGLRLTGGDATDLGGGLSNKDAGGGVYVIDADPILRQNWVFSNTAASGGGLFLWYSGATLEGNRVISNSAGYYGGGLTLRESDALLVRNEVTENVAYSGGGLFLYASDATLRENRVVANAADTYGGGLYLGDSDAILEQNDVTGNAAEHSGGVYLFASDATLTRNRVAANRATYNGGGLYLYDSDATFDGDAIVANGAGSLGAGLYLYHRSDAIFFNTVVADNQGTGLDVRSSAPRLLHATIARNGGSEGRGINVANVGSNHSTVAMTNTILVSHSVGIEAANNSQVRLEATLWANDVDWLGEGEIITHGMNYWGDPAFADPDAGDYRITQGSVAQDAGVEAGVITDMEGQLRPFGPGYDLGADERHFHPALALAQRAVPNPVAAGSTLTFTLQVTNTGDTDLQLAITDHLPIQVTPAEALVWMPNSLAPGAAWTTQVTVTVSEDYAGPLLNRVRVTSSEGAKGSSDHEVTVVEKLITIGPSQGGTLTAVHADGITITLQAAPGAVFERTQLGYTAVPTIVQPLADFDFAQGAFELAAFRRGAPVSGLAFERPLTVTLAWDGAGLGKVDPDSLTLRFWDGSAWSDEGITVLERDVLSQRLVSSVAHLSQFALFAREGQSQLYLPLVLR